VIPFGSRALRFTVPEGRSRSALLAELRAIPGVVDVVLTESVGMVVGGDGAELRAAIARAEDAGGAGAREDHAGAGDAASRLHVIEVVYDGEDLDEVARVTGLSREDVIRAHADREHTVAMLGFLPGFAYLRGVDPRLALPRRESPRARVAAGSVAIAAGYTGIYPCASPGGWHLLGRAPAFSPWAEGGAALALGDRVRFEPVGDSAATRAPAPAPAMAARRREVTGAHIVLTKVAGPALLVDGGRPGHMHEGVPPGGALVPEALARANAALGNAAGACAIELYGAVAVRAVGGAVAIADDRRGAILLRDGEAAEIATGGEVRARYLAVPDGFDVPDVLGGRGTLLVAGLGGLEGRALRRGDAIAPVSREARSRVAFGAAGAASAASASAASALGDRDDAPITVTIGPDPVPRATIETIMATPFRVSHAADRTGTRLEGPPLEAPRTERASSPMIAGAIELTPRGLIVLGPDHPTTGGYPVVAVVRHDALGRLFRKPIGSEVRFAVDFPESMVSPPAG
jgi:KipI family sensor histidine kinase inhibitor